jgi:hypothetical protein
MVIVYVDGFPMQPFNSGVTVIVAVIGAFVLLVAVKEGTSPVPFAARPMFMLLFVQLYVAPAGTLENDDAGTVAL